MASMELRAPAATKGMLAPLDQKEAPARQDLQGPGVGMVIVQSGIRYCEPK